MTHLNEHSIRSFYEIHLQLVPECAYLLSKLEFGSKGLNGWALGRLEQGCHLSSAQQDRPQEYAYGAAIRAAKMGLSICHWFLFFVFFGCADSTAAGCTTSSDALELFLTATGSTPASLIEGGVHYKAVVTGSCPSAYHRHDTHRQIGRQFTPEPGGTHWP